MDCSRFQEQLTDYLDGVLEARSRAECAAHRLRCRGCRELYNDVRATVTELSQLEQMPAPLALEERILQSTAAGAMLNCQEFDQLLERFFDGVILAPTFQTFQAHFETCRKCRRLLGSIEHAVALCHEVKEAEVEVPDTLCDRIVAATSGHRARPSLGARARAMALGHMRALWTRQVAAAALIFMASFSFIHLRFGSVSGLASEAEAQAERIYSEGHAAINQTGVLALAGLQRFSDEVGIFLRDQRAVRKPAAQSSTGGAAAAPAAPARQTGVKRDVREPR